MKRSKTYVLGQFLILVGLAVPLYGLAVALTAPPETSDLKVIGFEMFALGIGYLLFQAGRWMVAKNDES